MSYLPKLAPAVGNGLGGMPERQTGSAPFGERLYFGGGTYQFVVPKNVSSICAVVVGGGGGQSSPAGNTELVGILLAKGGGNAASSTPIGGSVGGGNGGTGGGSGGGAGAKSGNGGGVGLYGQGASGVFGGELSGSVDQPNSRTTRSISGSDAGGGVFGFATTSAGAGGDLRYMNNIAVSPDQIITVIVGAGGATPGSAGPTTAPPGAARIIWGEGRSFPFNAA